MYLWLIFEINETWVGHWSCITSCCYKNANLSACQTKLCYKVIFSASQQFQALSDPELASVAAPAPAESSAWVISLLCTWKCCWALLAQLSQTDQSVWVSLLWAQVLAQDTAQKLGINSAHLNLIQPNPALTWNSKSEPCISSRELGACQGASAEPLLGRLPCSEPHSAPSSDWTTLSPDTLQHVEQALPLQPPPKDALPLVQECFPLIPHIFHRRKTKHQNS